MRVFFFRLFQTCLFITMTCPMVVSAQSSSVGGRVLDGLGIPVPFANVVLLQLPDSTMAGGTVSDTLGRYRFGELLAGSYKIVVHHIGYHTYVGPVVSIGMDEGTVFPDVVLSASDTKLEEVTISSSRPFIEQHLDRVVVNAESSPLSAGGTALDLLERSPGVMVDHQTETVRMLNRPGVTIHINGRPSPLSGSDLLAYLRALGGDQVSRIEIITQPSSKYDAAGNAGIINIVLKKDMTHGTNGSVSAGAGWGFLPRSRDDLFRGTLNASIHHRAKKFYAYSTVSLLRDGSYSENNIDRTFTFDSTTSAFEQRIRRDHNSESLNIRAGADHFISDRTTVGLGIDMGLLQTRVNGINATEAMTLPVGHGSDFTIDQRVGQDAPRVNISSNLNFRHGLKNRAHVLTLDLDYLNFSSSSDQTFDATFYDHLSVPTHDLRQQGVNRSKLQVGALRMDMELPLNDRTAFEVGLKSSYVHIDSELGFTELTGNVWLNDTGKSNHFIYAENINAVYGIFRKTLSKLSLQLGLRAEHTWADGRSVTLGNSVLRNYVSLFPSVFSSYRFNDTHTLKFSYSRRIDRPRYDQLNPFIIVLDPYSYATGNPYLQPQFTNAVELGYHLRTHSITFNYSRTDQLIQELTIPNDSTRVTRTMETNFDHVDDLSARVSLQFTVKKLWQIHFQSIVFYKNFRDSDLLGGQLAADRWMCYMSLGNNIGLPRKWAVELSAWYMSPFVEGIIVGNNHRFAVSAGIQKTLLKDRAKIRLSMSDIFLTSFIDGHVDYRNVQLTFRPRQTTRRLMLTFSYSIGSSTVKTAQRNRSASDAEKQRISQ